MQENQAITGRCHCGNISYEITDKITDSSYCSCRACQRASGTLKVPFVTVQKDGFNIKTGELSNFRNSSEDLCDVYGQWFFCPKCGTQIYWESNNENFVTFFAGTLDNTDIFIIKQ